MRTHTTALPLVIAFLAAITIVPQAASGQAASKSSTIRRLPDGKPDLTGYYNAETSGANVLGLGGILIDPPDKKLPYQEWAEAEKNDRGMPHRGYDDPTAHCFPAGIPRSLYFPSPYQILQPPGYFLMLFERMSWRIIPLNNGPHLTDNVR